MSRAVSLLGLAALLLAAEPPIDDAATLREAEMGDEAPALVDYFRRRSVSEPDRAKLNALVRQLGAADYNTREQASRELEEFGHAAVRVLRGASLDPDAEVARRAQRALTRIERVSSIALSAAAARELGRQRPPGAAAALLGYLPQADSESVAAEVLAALAVVADRDGTLDPAILSALADPMPLRRAAAATAAAPYQRDLVRKLLRDPDAEVRLAAASGLAAAGDRDAVPVIIDLLTDLPPRAAWKAEDRLAKLATNGGPGVTLGPTPEDRIACRDAWRVWWTRHEAEIDPARLSSRPPLLGLTLHVQSEKNGVTGRLQELGTDGRPRWQIGGLMMPFDARMLPGERVLIAEQNAHRVTERDLTGRIRWEKAVRLPVACRRRPQGTIFVASRPGLFEFDRAGKIVFQHDRKQQDIVAGDRADDGSMAYLTNGGQCVRLGPEGQDLNTFSVGSSIPYLATLTLLPQGHLLMTHKAAVVEYNPEGKIVWRADADGPGSAERLPTGNTLVAEVNRSRVVELDRRGRVVAEQAVPDMAFPTLRARRR